MDKTKHNCGCAHSSCAMPKATPYHRSLISGAMGGMVGSIIIAVSLVFTSKLHSVDLLSGSQSSVLGFFIIFIPGVIFGMIAGILLRFIPKCPAKTAMFGLGYGVLLWIVGSLLVSFFASNNFAFDLAPNSSQLWYIVYAEISIFISRMFTACVCDKH